jgi:hypothetical protein
MIPDPILLLLSVSASFSRNTMDFPCIFGLLCKIFNDARAKQSNFVRDEL